MTVVSCIAGNNADLLRSVAELYIEPDDVIVDATYGEGGFWRRLPELSVIKHDLHKIDGVDLRALPEADGSVDVLALDPPYRLDESTPNEAAPSFSNAYGLQSGNLYNGRAGWDALTALYDDGIREAARVLSPSGRVLIKCQDAISGQAIEPMLERVLHSLRARELKLLDLFVLFSGTGPGSGRWVTQQRARRAHSYLVVGARSRYWQRREKVMRKRVVAGQLFDREAV